MNPQVRLPKTVTAVAVFTPLLFLQGPRIAWATSPPLLSSVTPASGPSAGGTAVTISGDHIYRPRSVTFGGVAAHVTSSGVTFIKAVVPPHSVGAVDVAVVGETGASAVLHQAYTYEITIGPASLPAGIPGISYNQTLLATGGTPPYQWSVKTGALPSGLSLSASTGVISGVPAQQYGTFSWSVQVTDSSNPSVTTTNNLSMTIQMGLKPGPIPATYFGMSVINPSNWPGISFGAFGKGGAVTWAYLEGSKGQFNWSRLDAFVQNAQNHHMPIFWTNYGVPGWAAADPSSCSTPPGAPGPQCTSSVSNIQNWDDFTTALVTRYKGKISMYELWNEPDGIDCTASLSQMVTLTTHFYNTIRQIDPAAQIASPTYLKYQDLDSYFAAGGPTGIDVVAIHGYANANDRVPEALAGEKTVGTESVMLKYNINKAPIWDTESSWGISSKWHGTADTDVAFVVRSYLLHWSLGVPKFDWYAWDDPEWGALWNSSNGPSKAAVGYSQVYSWMVGATMPQPCSVNGTVYTCPLTRSGGYSALAVWDTAQTCNTTGCTTSAYRPDLSYTQYRDTAGNTTSIQPGQVIDIGAKPLLLENQNP